MATRSEMPAQKFEANAQLASDLLVGHIDEHPRHRGRVRERR